MTGNGFNELQNRARQASGPHPTFARSGNGDQHIMSVKSDHSTKIRSAGLGMTIWPRQEVSCSSRLSVYQKKFLSGAGVTHRADSVATMMCTETHTAWHPCLPIYQAAAAAAGSLRARHSSSSDMHVLHASLRSKLSCAEGRRLHLGPSQLLGLTCSSPRPHVR